MHTKQASTVEMFVEIWKTDIQPGLSNTSLSNSSTTPHTSLPNSTPLSAPRDKATPSRKRTAADANLHQQSTTPPALRPVHIISETQLPGADADDATQLDEGIEKGFVGNDIGVLKI